MSANQADLTARIVALEARMAEMERRHDKLRAEIRGMHATLDYLGYPRGAKASAITNHPND